MTLKSPFMLASGDFFFRYRAYMFPIIFIGMLCVFRPQIIVNETITDIIIWAGFIIAMLGQGLRIFTIGFDYIERGGKEGKVYASRLVTGGIYNHVRNPMYLGNILMAIGIGLYGCAPLAFVIFLPFFIFFYYAIMSSEENFLRGKFGLEYEDFCRRVNRLWPSFTNISQTLSGFTFNWRRPLEKENGTAFWTFTALTLLPLWRNYMFKKNEAFAQYAPFAIAIMVVLIPVYITLRILKRKGALSQA